MSGNRERQNAIEAQTGRPFCDVVREYAEAGWGKRATGEALGYEKTAFSRLLKRRGWSDWFVPGTQTVQFKAGVAKRAAMPVDLEPARRANPTYNRVRIDGIDDTLAGHCRRRGLSVRTAYARVRRGMSLYRAVTARVAGR